MTGYIYIAIIAWFTFGVVSLLDKFLLQKPVHNEKVYTFYTGIFSFFAVVLFLPFAEFTTAWHLIFNISCGLIFLIAQYFLFKSLLDGEASTVIPITGALVPIFTLIFSKVFLGLHLSGEENLAFILLVIGTVVISLDYRTTKAGAGIKFWMPFLSSLFFAIYFSLVKIAYDPFLSNFAFVRLGSFIGAIIMFSSPAVREAVINRTKNVKTTISALFLTKEITAGLAFILLNYAVSIGHPAVINAMQGIEYAVLFLLALLLSKYKPKLINERVENKTLAFKILGISLIVLGVIYL